MSQPRLPSGRIACGPKGAVAAGHPLAATAGLRMLEAGGTLRHKELLAPFGLDASRPDFWQQGLNVIAKMIDELED